MNFILIEDHNLVRQGVSKIIEEKSDFRCSGTFSSIDEAKVFLADYCRSTDYEPLICIVDINLGDNADDADGLSLISFIKENYPKMEPSLYFPYIKETDDKNYPFILFNEKKMVILDIEK